MAERNEIHTGSITGSIVVAGSGNTINAKLRVELRQKPPPTTEVTNRRYSSGMPALRRPA